MEHVLPAVYPWQGSSQTQVPLMERRANNAAKRTAEDDVQFIGSKPVKRARDARQNCFAIHKIGQGGLQAHIMCTSRRPLPSPLEPPSNSATTPTAPGNQDPETARSSALQNNPRVLLPFADGALARSAAPAINSKTPDATAQEARQEQDILPRVSVRQDHDTRRLDGNNGNDGAPMSLIERRGSTGGVELPSQVQPYEPPTTSRGISLPAMEFFTFQQNPSSQVASASPQLSPKQLPQTILQAELMASTTPTVTDPSTYPAPHQPFDLDGFGNTVGLTQTSSQETSAGTQAPVNQIPLAMPPSYPQQGDPFVGLGTYDFTGGLFPGSMAQSTAAFPWPPGEASPSCSAPAEKHAVGGQDQRQDMSDGDGDPAGVVPNSRPCNTDNEPRCHRSSPQKTPMGQLRVRPRPANRPSPESHSADPGFPGWPPFFTWQSIHNQMGMNAGLSHVNPVYPQAGIPSQSRSIPFVPGSSNIAIHGQQCQNQLFPYYSSPTGQSNMVQMPAPPAPTVRIPIDYLMTPSPQHCDPTAQAFPYSPQAPTDIEDSKEQALQDLKSPPAKSKSKAASGAAKAESAKPKARAKRRTGPNLYIDIAETCEATFPYDEVATRHDLPRQKVVEALQGVVQLPLLRSATDKRRAGKLGTTRMREYNKAKRELQAANKAAAAAAMAVTHEQIQAQTQSQAQAQPPSQSSPPPPPKFPATKPLHPVYQPTLLQIAQSMGPMNANPEAIQGAQKRPW